MASKRTKKKSFKKNARRAPRRPAKRVRNAQGFLAKPKQAVKTLREMNVAMANAMPGISRLAPDGTYAKVNDYYAKALGYEPDHLVGELWTTTVHPDSFQIAQAAYETMLALGKGEFEARAVRKDGSIFWKQVLMVKIVDTAGRHVGHHCFMRDITERKLAEERLLESEAKYRSLFEATDEGFCIVEVLFESDRPVDYRFLEISPSFERQTGLVNACGKRMRELAPKHEEHWFEIFGRISKTGKSERFQNHAKQLGRWYDVFAFRVGKPEDHQVAILFNDITEHKQAEAALRESEVRLRSFFENAAVGAAQINTQGRFIQVNDRLCQITGYTRDELLTMGPLDLDHPDEVEADRQHIKDFFDAKNSYLLYEKRWVHKSSRSLWVCVTLSPIRDDAGVSSATAALIEDITERKWAEEALLESDTQLRLLNESLERRVKERTAVLREREAQLTALGARLLRAQEEERRRISCDLHDDVMQRMGALALELHHLASSTSLHDVGLQSQIKAFGTSAEQLTTDLQRMAHQLHPSILEFGGLETAVREHANDVAVRTGLTVTLVTRNVPKHLPLDCATCLYRVLQEGLQNVQKHAGATTVSVSLVQTSRGIGLCIHDNGRGITHSDGDARRKGLGLISMEERVGMLNGTFRIRTKSGHGAELHAWVPLEAGGLEA